MVDFSSNYRGADVGSSAYGDLLFVNGDLALTSDANASGTNNVAQDCLQRLSTFSGEVFVDKTLGVPYLTQLLGQKTPASTWDAILQAQVLQTPGVIQLTQWSSTPNYKTRQLIISFRAVTSSGAVTYNGAVDLNAS